MNSRTLFRGSATLSLCKLYLTKAVSAVSDCQGTDSPSDKRALRLHGNRGCDLTLGVDPARWSYDKRMPIHVSDFRYTASIVSERSNVLMFGHHSRSTGTFKHLSDPAACQAAQGSDTTGTLIRVGDDFEISAHLRGHVAWDDSTLSCTSVLDL